MTDNSKDRPSFRAAFAARKESLFVVGQKTIPTMRPTVAQQGKGLGL
jgi:hypothetical protein